MRVWSAPVFVDRSLEQPPPLAAQEETVPSLIRASETRVRRRARDTTAVPGLAVAERWCGRVEERAGIARTKHTRSPIACPYRHTVRDWVTEAARRPPRINEPAPNAALDLGVRWIVDTEVTHDVSGRRAEGAEPTL
jgi:hypothetical protein